MGFRYLIDLNDLYIYCNELTSLPDSIRNLNNLQKLDCSYNKLTHLSKSIDKLNN